MEHHHHEHSHTSHAGHEQMKKKKNEPSTDHSHAGGLEGMIDDFKK